jgi:peptidyl-prolyl cis-trans isomerase C
MHKTLRFLASSLVAISFAIPATAQETPADTRTVVATVNGTEITLGHMILAYASLPEQYRSLPDEVLFPGILDQLIEQTALAQSFADELPERVALRLENERRALTANEAIEAALEGAITDEALQKAYDAKFKDAQPGQEYNAAHILVDTRDAAEELIEQLENGADFAELAKEHSTGPSGPNGGALGWFGLGMMVPSFEAATIALEVGGISAPVETQFGWHVILLNETRQAGIPTLEQERAALEQDIRVQTAQDYINAQTAAAQINKTGAFSGQESLIKQLNLLD